MAALCLDASLETLRPVCYRGTHRDQGDLCRCFHEGSLQTVQVVVTLLASLVIQNSPQFMVPVVEVWTHRGHSSALIKTGTLLRSHSWVFLALGRTESCWKTHSWPLKRVTLSCFTTLCSTTSWYTRTPVSPRDGTPSTKSWRRKGDGIPAPSEFISRDVWA